MFIVAVLVLRSSVTEVTCEHHAATGDGGGARLALASLVLLVVRDNGLALRLPSMRHEEMHASRAPNLRLDANALHGVRDLGGLAGRVVAVLGERNSGAARHTCCSTAAFASPCMSSWSA